MVVKKKYVVLSILMVGGFTALMSVKIGGAPKKPPYKFFPEVKEAADKLKKEVRTRAPLSKEQVNEFKDLSNKVKKIYEDLFTNEIKKKFMPGKTEPPARDFLSFTIQAKIFQELSDSTQSIKAGLEKAYRTQPTHALKEEIDILNLNLQNIATELKKIKDIPARTDKLTSYDDIKKYYENVALWGNFDEARLAANNKILDGLASDVVKDIFQHKKKILAQLKGRLNFVKPRTPEVADLERLISFELKEAEKKLKELAPKPAPSPQELQEQLRRLSVELQALQVQASL